jgi:hypothetical protein
MRRSSKILLIVAGLLLVGLGLLYLQPGEAVLPSMTPALAESIMRRGVEAVKRKDVSTLMSLMSPNATILERRAGELRRVIEESLNDVPGELDIKVSNISVTQKKQKAIATCNMEVGQTTPQMEASYFRASLRVHFEPYHTTHWLGLYTSKSWKIASVESDNPLGSTDR